MIQVASVVCWLQGHRAERNCHCICKDKRTLCYLVEVIADILLLMKTGPFSRCFSHLGWLLLTTAFSSAGSIPWSPVMCCAVLALLPSARSLPGPKSGICWTQVTALQQRGSRLSPSSMSCHRHLLKGTFRHSPGPLSVGIIGRRSAMGL